MTTNCSGLVMLNEDDDFTCECRSVVVKRTVSVTWYKNGKQLSESKGENTLYLSDVKVKDSGTYTCVAQSNNTLAKDEKSIEITVSEYILPPCF